MLRGLLSIFFVLTAGAARAEGCVPLGWESVLAPGEQSFEVVERTRRTENRELIGVSYGEPAGQFTKFHLFIDVVDGCFMQVVAAGSYAMTAALPGPDVHLDHYMPNKHATLDFRDTPPNYYELRDIALQVFE